MTVDIIADSCVHLTLWPCPPQAPTQACVKQPLEHTELARKIMENDRSASSACMNISVLILEHWSAVVLGEHDTNSQCATNPIRIHAPALDTRKAFPRPLDQHLAPMPLSCIHTINLAVVIKSRHENAFWCSKTEYRRCGAGP